VTSNLSSRLAYPGCSSGRCRYKTGEQVLSFLEVVPSRSGCVATSSTTSVLGRRAAAERRREDCALSLYAVFRLTYSRWSHVAIILTFGT
jgi:hypothetical protein